ncbi:MAG: TRAP transporter substrate-binding protein [Rhodospirillaceae bacterium]|nr:TRAP transporter substrate-binding protein [Rhodospirillaceae bacterium]
MNRFLNLPRLVFACVLAVVMGQGALALDVTAGGTGIRNTKGEQKWLTYRDTVQRKSGGQIAMKMLIYGELGAEENLVAGIRRGRVNIANWSGAVTTTVVPEMALLYAPFLFDDYDEADFVMDRFLFPAYAKLFAEKDIHFLSWDEIGFSQVWSKTPILTPEDAKGKRFRVASSDAAQLFAQALGADVIPLPFSDIISSLQTGLIEAGETGTVMYVRTGIAGDAKHITLTDHSFATSVIVLRKGWLDGLSEDQRKILLESWIPIATSRQWTREEVTDDLARAQELGFTAHKISPEQRDRWRAATADVTRKLIERVGGNAQMIWDVAQEGKKAYAAGKAKN